MGILGLPIWQLIFFIFGIGAFVYVMGALFFPFGNHTDAFYVSRRYPTGSPEFLSALSHLVSAPIEHGGRAELLNNGQEFFPALVRDLNAAQKTITITTYIWESGLFSDAVIKVLIHKLEQGVEVRILLDGFGATWMPKKSMRRLREHGARVEKFRTPKYGMVTRFHRRNHRRAIVIDGNVGYIGGMSIADKWLGRATEKDSWRDMMVRVTGCLASHVQSAFAQLWTATSGEILSGPEFYPERQEQAGSGIQSINLASSPAQDTEPLPKFFWYSIASAEKNIYLTTPYLIPSRHIRHALAEAAARGVDVKVLVPSEHIDSAIVRLAGQYYYRGLLAAGVRIFEYQPSMLHTKALEIDGLWSVVGSANMDSRSLLLNEENIMGVRDEVFANNLEQVFLKDVEQSREITLREWQHRTIFKKFLQGLCARFAKQF